MESKGLSQVLYLIIAAAVLMMVGLSLVLAFGSGTDTSSISRPACVKNIELTCAENSGSTQPLPGSCTRLNNGQREVLQGVTAAGIPVADSIDEDDLEVTCS